MTANQVSRLRLDNNGGWRPCDHGRVQSDLKLMWWVSWRDEDGHFHKIFHRIC